MEKIIDLEDRIPTFREKRRRRTNLKFTLLIVVFVFILLVLLYFQSSISEIKKITINGPSLKDEAFYEEALSVKVGNSMWGFKQQELENELLSLPWVKSVEVKRKLLSTVQIDIEEWEKVAYVVENGDFYPVLENGETLKDEQENVPIDAPIFNDFEDEELRKRLLKELGKLDHSVLAMISQITVSVDKTDPYAITLFMNDGYEVRADLTTLASKLNYYPSIIAQISTDEQSEKGIIDIEVGTYYKAYSDVYKTSIEGEDSFTANSDEISNEELDFEEIEGSEEQ